MVARLPELLSAELRRRPHLGPGVENIGEWPVARYAVGSSLGVCVYLFVYIVSSVGMRAHTHTHTLRVQPSKRALYIVGDS